MRQYEELVRIGPGNGTKLGEVTRLNGEPVAKLEKFIAASFRGFSQSHPCIGARSVFVNGNFFFAVLPDMESVRAAISTVRLAEQYLSCTDNIDDHVKTLALVFIGTAASPEDFAGKYWRFAQLVHDVDAITNDWDINVSSNPIDPTFEFSIAGRAIFTTTLNPGHPRVARRFAYPVWVCNQTRQFDVLREKGLFTEWQQRIREADANLDPSGLPNPILTDHGSASAAHQLAGWPVENCPLTVRRSTDEKTEAATALMRMLQNEPMNLSYVAELCERGMRKLRIDLSIV